MTAALAMDWVVAALAVIGAAFLAISALGVVRMPDLYSRLHAATKAGPVGVASIALAVALELSRADVTLLALLLVGFVLLTAPVAAHVIARASHVARVPIWQGTIRDELREAERRGGPSTPPRPEAEP